MAETKTTSLDQPKPPVEEGKAATLPTGQVEGGIIAENRGNVSKVLNEETLPKLRARFEENMYLHEGINWEDVERSLTPKDIEILEGMDDLGHEPDIYHEDDIYYYFGTCSNEIPETTINTVYNQEALEKERELINRQKHAKPIHPRIRERLLIENPAPLSAVKWAESMGTELMTYEQYEILQSKGDFDLEGRDRGICRLFTPEKMLAKSDTIVCSKDRKRKIDKDMYDPEDHGDHLGFRASFKVKKVKDAI
jgi:hypothetical protein